VKCELVILEWAAYADGLVTRDEWLAWARGPAQLPAEHVQQVPALSDMPAMMRRRVDRLGRLACQVAYWCQQVAGDVPLVFASRYGDAHRSLQLLGDLVQQQPLSPTGFALSVHNAVAALYSIARGDTRNAVVVAGGRATVTAALVEAAALIADGEPEVLVVCYEAPLPEHYAHFQDEHNCEFAWAWRVTGAHRGSEGVTVLLQLGEETTDAAPLPLMGRPEGLAVLRQVLQQIGKVGGDQVLVRHERPGVCARWSAHA
jgi:hypothetical protein